MKNKFYIYRKFLQIAFFSFILVIATFLTINHLEKKVSQENIQLLKENALQNAKTTANAFNNDLQLLTQIADFMSKENNFDIDFWFNTFSNSVLKNKFQQISIIDYTGKLHSLTGSSMDISEKNYLSTVLKGNSIITDSLVDRISGKKVNIYAVPLYKRGKVFAVLSATKFSLTNQMLLPNFTYNNKGYSYIIKKNGQPIMYSTHVDSAQNFDNFFDTFDNVEQSKSKIDLLKKSLSNSEEGTFQYNARGKNRFLTYIPLGINDWFLISSIPYSEITRDTQAFISLTSIIATLIIAIFALILFSIIINKEKTSAEIFKLAYFDKLTGINNLDKFKIDSVRILKQNHSKQYLVIKFDLHSFAFFNEVYGIEAADNLLKKISCKLIKVFSATDTTFARISSDEFIVLSPLKTFEANWHCFMELLHEVQPNTSAFTLHINQGRYIIECSETNDIDQIINKVSLAHKYSKTNSERLSYYDNFLVKKDFDAKKLELSLKKALERNEFDIFLQSKQNLSNSQLGGAEALVRWNKNGEFISPSKFIHLFEKNGSIVDLDFYVFEKTCILIRSWLDNNLKPIVISTNFSKLHVYNNNFITNLCQIADKYRVPYNLLELELTENILLEDYDIFIKFLDSIKTKGFNISMDDFGSGYSSLGLLRLLPIDTIKIDRSFFSETTLSEKSLIIIQAVISLSKNLNIKVVAEGVEVKDCVEILKKMGCDMIQGYYYSKPVPASELTDLLEST